jgi:hypothetical protein
VQPDLGGPETGHRENLRTTDQGPKKAGEDIKEQAQ